ncbi:hypothetical protein FH039_07205 [Thermococcus indicus]|uniref:Uncharacterized protein n=1 Tax=Thermococcus indicus TaxID=2586643 RepID=A0A4Y5SMX7_9EURY|nr:hypothetical protein [Thermococcus indicus]QDA31431.1 hypothetical protein FH039_07205 [Thermococcus indicus]
MSELVMKAIKKALLPDESVRGPIIPASSVEISRNGDPTLATIGEPISESFSDVYLVNTDRRLLLVSTGIDSSVKIFPGSSVSSSRSAKVWGKVSYGSVVHSLPKGEVHSFSLSSSISSSTSYQAEERESTPSWVWAILGLGALLLFYGLASSSEGAGVIGVLGLIVGAVAAKFAKATRLVVSESVTAKVDKENSAVIVLHVPTPREIVESIEGSEKRIERKLESSFVFLRITFHKSVGQDEVLEFVKSI